MILAVKFENVMLNHKAGHYNKPDCFIWKSHIFPGYNKDIQSTSN